MTSDPERWIVIPRWDDYQHRDAARANVPTWLKAFTKLLSDDDYLDLSGHRRAVLHGLWLEYARSTRRLRLDTRSLTHRLNLRVTMADLEALNHAGWIEFHASRYAGRHAGTEESREEKNREQDQNQEPGPFVSRPPAPAAANGTAPDHGNIQETIAQSLAAAAKGHTQ